MNVKKVGVSLPLLAGIAFGIVALATPFLVANHYVFSADQRYSTDNYMFFFWGKYYTVAGVNTVISQMILYDLGDFPVYAMSIIIIGLIAASISFFGGRGLILNFKGRIVKIKLDYNPLWFQLAAVALLLLAYLYMNTAQIGVQSSLVYANYVIEIGPSLQFLAGSIAAFVISSFITAVKFLNENKEQPVAG